MATTEDIDPTIETCDSEDCPQDVVAEEGQSCDPAIEECEAEENVTDLSKERPDSMPALYIGIVAVLKGLVPLMMRLLVAGDGLAKTTSSLYPTAMLIWWLGNLFVWGTLSILWPLSYSDILVSEYLMLTLYGGLWIGAVLAVVNTIMMLVSTMQDNAAALYLTLVLLIDGLGVFLTYLCYDDAYAYYMWVGDVESEETKQVDGETISGDGDGTDTGGETTDNGGKNTDGTDGEGDPDNVDPDVDTDDSSPFTDFDFDFE